MTKNNLNPKKDASEPNETLNEPKKPDYTGYGISVWKNISKKGLEYLTIKIPGHNDIVVFDNKKDD